MKKYFLLAFAEFCITNLFAQSVLSSAASSSLPNGAIQFATESLKWLDAPAPFPAGVKMIVLEGSPKKEGIFTVRFKFPPGVQLAAHWHPKDERVTILSGALYVGFGDSLIKESATKFTAGSYYVNPVLSHHYVFTDEQEGAELQITGIGPWGLTFVENKEK